MIWEPYEIQVDRWADLVKLTRRFAEEQERKRMLPYPRMFKLVRDRSDRTGDKLGHVADGIVWSPAGPVTLHWLGANSSVATFNTMRAMLAVHGHYDPARFRNNTRVEWTREPAKLDRRVFDAMDELFEAISDYVTAVEKKTVIPRDTLKAAFGRLQDYMTDAAAAQEAAKLTVTNTCNERP